MYFVPYFVYLYTMSNAQNIKTTKNEYGQYTFTLKNVKVIITKLRDETNIFQGSHYWDVTIKYDCPYMMSEVSKDIEQVTRKGTAVEAAIEYINENF